MAIQYSTASWRIQIAFGAFVEVHVTGARDDRDLASVHDTMRTAQVLKDVGHALERVAKRWQNIEASDKRERVNG